MGLKIKELIKVMTLKEKASLCSGKDFWTTKEISRLGIPSIMMTDGPHGLRKQGGNTDNLGVNDSIPATCFPTSSALGCSWDKGIINEIGKAIGDECNAENVSIILGPGVNIKRSPLCGRNFEYFSEDPILSGELGAAFINGVQSTGVGTSLKHFAANNQESERMTISSEVDEKTLREIYLKAFEIIVKKAKPWTVMCAYNKLNGTYCSENKFLLTDILREEWGFDGIVVSDWGAVDDRVNALKSGLDLEMPASNGITDKEIVEAVKSGELEEGILDKVVENILKLIDKAMDNKNLGKPFNIDKNHKIARNAASECIVLLKNEDNILPLDKNKINNLSIIGEFAKKPRYQGGGSSHVNATKVECVYDEIVKILGDEKNISYSKGYYLEKDEIDEDLINTAKDIAEKSEVTVLCVGLPDSFESEGYDRKHMSMPNSHIRLIEEVTKVQKNVVVVLSNGSIIDMNNWDSKVKAIVEAGLLGQGGGGATADVIFGNVNPSGKLSETVPMNLSHNPSYLNFPGADGKVHYKEGIYVGYRYYDKKDLDVKYPFGYGLSYTEFEYNDLRLNFNEINGQQNVNVRFKLKNIGTRKGKEIAQIYIKSVENKYPIEKELKAFEKIELNPNEEKEISINLTKEDFTNYNEVAKAFTCDSKEFKILVGASSRDIRLEESIMFENKDEVPVVFTTHTMVKQWLASPRESVVIAPVFEGLKQTMGANSEENEDGTLMINMMMDMPISKLINFSGGAFTKEMLNYMILEANKK